ncbi:MAG: hypothetical protein RIF41_04015 [Polyangiaceae bacterium]
MTNAMAATPQDLAADRSTSRIELSLRMQRFHLPPVESALVIGRRAGIGPKAMSKALTEMVPGAFTLIEVDHPVAEAVIVRNTHLRTVPADRLVAILLARAEPIMDESDMLHVRLDVVVKAIEELDI